LQSSPVNLNRPNAILNTLIVRGDSGQQPLDRRQKKIALADGRLQQAERLQWFRFHPSNCIEDKFSNFRTGMDSPPFLAHRIRKNAQGIQLKPRLWKEFSLEDGVHLG